MLKAIFLDYTGTITQEAGPNMEQLLMRCYQNSDAPTPKEMLKFWWGTLKKLEEQSYGEKFLTEDEIVDKILEAAVEKLHLKENLDELHRLCQRFWMYAPAFEDVPEFFEKCPLPIYVLTNDGVSYIEEAMRHKQLSPAGIISGEMVRAYKPHREIFEKALEVSGCRPEEVIHIGDSMISDVQGARNAGIRPILLDRTGQQETEGVTVVKSLSEVLDFF